MSDTKSRSSRRRFLAVVGIGGAATAAVVATAVTSKVMPSPKAPGTLNDKRRGKGYQMTDHIENYYRTAKV